MPQACTVCTILIRYSTSHEMQAVPVVGSVLEAQRQAVREVVPELRREAPAQLVRVSGLLALQDPLVLLLLGGGLEALPGQ